MLRGESAIAAVLAHSLTHTGAPLTPSERVRERERERGGRREGRRESQARDRELVVGAYLLQDSSAENRVKKGVKEKERKKHYNTTL